MRIAIIEIDDKRADDIEIFNKILSSLPFSHSIIYECSNEKSVFSSDICGIKVDFNSRQVFRDGVQINLTHLEYRLLSYLISAPGHVFSKEQILKAVWGYEGESTMKIVSNAIYKLRSKLEYDKHNPLIIKTVHGGYMFSCM